MLLWKYPLVSMLLEKGFTVKSFHTHLICFRTIDFQQTSWGFVFFFSMWQHWYFSFFFFFDIAKLKKALISRPSTGTWTMKQRDVQCINFNIFISQKPNQNKPLGWGRSGPREVAWVAFYRRCCLTSPAHCCHFHMKELNELGYRWLCNWQLSPKNDLSGKWTEKKDFFFKLGLTY